MEQADMHRHRHLRRALGLKTLPTYKIKENEIKEKKRKKENGKQGKLVHRKEVLLILSFGTL